MHLDSQRDVAAAPSAEGPIELSVVMPCLNEADTLGKCIRKAQDTILQHCIAGEVIVADNGSTDGSVEIARKANCRLVFAPVQGYGAALMAGIDAAQGQFVIIGDADESYDFRELPRFLELLRQGYELVQGCRLPSGGGTILPGAMPFLHRWFGNPALSAIARIVFGTPLHDIYCGMRGFTKDLYDKLDQRCTGMEFATEMVIKSHWDGHQEPLGWSSRATGSALRRRRSRSHCIATAEKRVRETCGPFAMGGPVTIDAAFRGPTGRGPHPS